MMRNVKWIEYVILAGLLGIFSLTGPVVEAKETLIIGLDEKTTSLDPAKGDELVSTELMNLLYERLVNFEGGNYLQPVNELAESWELSDDGKIWTFHLRKDATFSSGHPVDADAVVFSLRRCIALNEAAAWMLTQFGLQEDAIAKQDEFTVQIVLEQPYAPNLFLSCLATFAGSILDRKVLLEHEVNGDMGSAWLEEHSAGSARYVLAERSPRERIVLQANPNSWKPKPAFERVILQNVPEPMMQMALLKQGKIDIAYNLQPAQLEQLRNTEEIQLAKRPFCHVRYLGMNLAYEPFQHPKVREAIRYAIDYDGIIQHVFQGDGIKIQTVVPKGFPGYLPLTPYSQDVDKAKRLLVEAGYPNGFKSELLCFDTYPWVDVAVKLKENLDSIGISVTLTPKPRTEMLKKSRARDFQLYHGNWNFDYADPSNMVTIFGPSDSDNEDASVKVMGWRHRYIDQELFDLIQEAIRERNEEKRLEMYHVIQERILHDGPYAMLFSLVKQFAIRTEVADQVGLPSPFTGFPTLK